MPRKRAAKPTTLVPHRSPQLAELLDAAKRCDMGPLLRFLAAGGQPDSLTEVTYSDGSKRMSPLFYKAITTHQNHESLTVLLEAGANADASIVAPDGCAWTALMAACNATCCLEPVRILLLHKANPCLKSAEGKTALHMAARAGRTDVCELLLEASGGAGSDVIDSLGCTPLAEAVSANHLAVVALLHRKHGADLTTTHSKGTLLHRSAIRGQRPLLEYLLRNGLDVNAKQQVAGKTALWVAAEEGNMAAVQTLLDAAARCLQLLQGGTLMWPSYY
jgi:ankyrin repeat protein